MSDDESNLSEYLTTLSERIKSGEYIYPEELAHCLSTAQDGRIPDAIRYYIVGTLKGEIKRPRGQRPLMLIERYKQHLHPVIYHFWYSYWLKHRPGGTSNFAKCIKSSDFWDSSAYNMALMMTARKYRGDSDKWATMRNIVEAHPLTARFREELALGANSKFYEETDRGKRSK